MDTAFFIEVHLFPQQLDDVVFPAAGVWFFVLRWYVPKVLERLALRAGHPIFAIA